MIFKVGGCAVGSAVVVATRSERAISFMLGEGLGTRDSSGGKEDVWFGAISHERHRFIVR